MKQATYEYQSLVRIGAHSNSQIVERSYEADLSPAQCIHQMFEARVERTPHATAVVFQNQSLSYRQLNRRANQLAHYLIVRGVGADDLVALCLPRSIEMVVAMLAVLKAGGAYIPLEPTLPSARLRTILADSGCALLLTESKQTFTLPPAVQRENLDQLSQQEKVQGLDDSIDTPVTAVNANHLAYCIYTSGSTGHPKGVLIEHKSLVNHCYAIKDAYRLSSHDRVLQFAGVSFDVMAEELFPTLIAGATVVLYPHLLTNWSSWEAWLRREQITVLNLPAAYWQDWVQELTMLPPSIRLVVAGSDKILPARLTEWQEKVSQQYPAGSSAGRSVEFLHAYGITEDTITTTLYEPADKTDPLADAVPIGRPLPHTQLYILDSELNRVPTLTPGELYIGGAGLARGYLNDPELTKKKFIPNPFARDGETNKLYKTGDLCRMLPDGNMEFLGRIDHQVKIRGFRIELGEIETKITQHPLIREAAVIVDEAANEKRLIAYVMPEKEAHSIQLWPCHADYHIYDSMMYYAMTNDLPRNRHYQIAIQQTVKDKVVVDIGTGQDFILSRFCLDAGAKRIYAIEAQQEAYQAARQKVEALGLQDKIILIHGLSTEVSLPEKVDVCVSELIGMMGSSEGVIPILNDARRFLKPDGVMVPERCLTQIAAVHLPDEFADAPHFSEISKHYGQLTWEKIGHPFDFRLAIRNFPHGNVMSTDASFEDLLFRETIAPEDTVTVTLTIEKVGRIDGFLLWLRLYTIDNQVIDSLAERYHWLPVYLPVFYPGVEVSIGDTITVDCSRLFSQDDLNPDYRVKGRLHRQQHEDIDFEYDSLLYGDKYRSDPFYARLFADDAIPAIPETSSVLSTAALRAYLKEQLPAYMIPTSFVLLDKMPLTPGGKIDRRALAELDHRGDSDFGIDADSFVPPRNAIEQQLVGIWQEILGEPSIGIRDNFFDLGGHSLLALRLIAQIQQQFGVHLPVPTLFQAATIEALASQLAEHQDVVATNESREQASQPSLVPPLQPYGHKQPLFCVPGIGGHLLNLYDLARFMGTERPIYGLQAVGLDGQTAPHTTVEAMAAHYIEALQHVQPEGPYLLGGYSFGGTVAFEMAQQLQHAGHEVAQLLIVDMSAPPICVDDNLATWDEAQWIRALAQSMGIWEDEPDALSFDTLASLESRGQLRWFQAYLADRSLLPATSELSHAEGWLQVFKANRSMDYTPKNVFPTEITLFRSAEQASVAGQDASLNLPAWGWSQYAKGAVDVISVPGDHISMLKPPHVQTLAEQLQQVLQQSAIDPTEK